jgi:photosystem II stability/assembly factor-like uncharacterized protein
MLPLRSALAALALFAPAARAQPGDWSLLPQSPSHTYRFEDASFLTPIHGWIVDGGGRTHRTLDGGATWALRSSVNDYLRSVAFVSETHGWVGALYGPRRLYETLDGAATLTDVTARIAPAIGGGICGLWAVDADTVFGVGQYNGPTYVIRTTDGGLTWQSQNLTGLVGSLVDVVFLDGQRGFALGGTQPAGVNGGRVVVLATEDGGATWARRYVASAPPAGQGEWGWKLSFPTPLVGYASVERTSGTTAKVLKTTDGGLTWTELLVPGGGSTQGLGFLTAERGWISGRGVAMETTDGGATWTTTTSIDGSVNRFEFFGDTLGYAMGRRVFFLDARVPTAGPPSPAVPALALDPVAPNPARGAATLRFRRAPSSWRCSTCSGAAWRRWRWATARRVFTRCAGRAATKRAPPSRRACTSRGSAWAAR